MMVADDDYGLDYPPSPPDPPSPLASAYPLLNSEIGKEKEEQQEIQREVSCMPCGIHDYMVPRSDLA